MTGDDNCQASGSPFTLHSRNRIIEIVHWLVIFLSVGVSIFPFFRVEDHNEIIPLFDEQTNLLSISHQPFFLAALIEAEAEEHHTAVCEVCSKLKIFFLLLILG